MVSVERRRSRRRGLALAALAATLALVATAWLSWPRGSQRPRLERPGGVLLGAFLNERDHAVPRSIQLADMERQLGRRLAIVHSFDRWGDRFPTAQERAVATSGRIPFLNLRGLPSARIVDGSQDGYLRARAQAVRALGRPIMIQYYGEMDRRSAAAVGSPSQFVAAWRHIHALFDQEGATNAVWVWCPTGGGLRGTRPKAAAFYPGDDEVDWVCFDAYDWPRPDGRPARSFAAIALEPYRYLVRHMPGKPIMIGEFGTVEDPTDPFAKARWLDAAATTIQRQMPELAALVYFDTVAYENGRRIDWRLDSSAAAYRAWLRLAGRDHFRAAPPS
jgi:hypothetical protein